MSCNHRFVYVAPHKYREGKWMCELCEMDIPEDLYLMVFNLQRELAITANNLIRTEASLKLVQSHAKSAMDKLPAKWNEGFRAGLRQAIPYEKEMIAALAAEQKARQDDNAALTADNMKLEEENEKLRKGLQRVYDACQRTVPKQAIGEMLEALLSR